MRKLFIILFLTAWVPTGHTQTTDLRHDVIQNEDNQHLQAYRKHVRHMLERQYATRAQKTTIQKQRVIGESSYNPGPPSYIYDTTLYQYTGLNGSRFDFNFMLFNYSYPPTIDLASFPYDYTSTDVMADTITFQSRVFSTDTLKTQYVIAASYNLSDKLSSYKTYFYQQGLPDSGVLYYHTYTAQGHLSQLLVITDTLFKSDTVFKLQFYYDAQGRKDKDSIFSYAAATWLPAASVSYTYDGAGNITSVVTEELAGATWVPGTKYEHTFYPDNSLMTATWYQYDGTAFAPMRKDTFEYASGSTFFTTRTEYYMSSNGWAPSQQTSKFLNPQGLPDTVFLSFYSTATNSWQHFEKQHYAYDSDNNPVQRNWYSFDGINWSLIEVHNYYYEVYTVGIKTLTQQGEIESYPNPATDQITINWKGVTGQTVFLELLGASGQKLMSRACAMDKHTERISMQHLAAGFYLLILKDEAGSILYNQRVIKQ